MARRPIVARKQKTVRITKTEQYLVNKKYLGDEPYFTTPLSKTDYINSLNWYGYMCTVNDAREYILEYLIKVKREKDVKKIKALSDSEIPTTLAWISRMLTRDFVLPVEAKEYLDHRLKEITKSYKEPINNTKEEPKISVRDRMKERFHDIMGEIEGLIDDYMNENQEFSLYNWLQSNNIPAAYATSIINKLTPVLDELKEAYNTKDEQLKEAYRNYSKPKLKTLIDFYQNLCDDVSKYSGVVKKTRKDQKAKDCFC
jgi:hypothetical protein